MHCRRTCSSHTTKYQFICALRWHRRKFMPACFTSSSCSGPLLNGFMRGMCKVLLSSYQQVSFTAPPKLKASHIGQVWLSSGCGWQTGSLMRIGSAGLFSRSPHCGTMKPNHHSTSSAKTSSYSLNTGSSKINQIQFLLQAQWTRNDVWGKTGSLTQSLDELVHSSGLRLWVWVQMFHSPQFK